MKRVPVCVALIGLGVSLFSAARAQTGQGTSRAATAAGTPAPQTYKGLELSIGGLERASSAGLADCPPGANTVRAMTKPGEEFAIVTVKMKVLTNYQPAPLKRPVLTDTAGKTYNTAASFVDVGKVPEFSCAFPFRVPEGTKVKSVQIDTASFDLTSLDAKPR